jgi:Amidohydrolase family
MLDGMNRRAARMVLAVVCLLGLCAAHPAQEPAPSEAKTYAFVGGSWFDGKTFEPATFYSVAGTLTRSAPQHIDETIELDGGFVVPPFGDAHNHTLSGPHDLDAILLENLRDGVFYVKNPASIPRDTQQILDRVNRPDSVDVTFAGGGLTAPGGHPVVLYEKHLRAVKKPGPDGTFADLAYFEVGSEEDLERKWPLLAAGKPDFIKTHLLYSEEFEQRRDDPVYEGLRGLDPKLLEKIVAKAHAEGLRVSCHIETACDFRNALAAGIDEINHMPGYFPDFAHPDWFAILPEDAERAAAQKVVVVTTIHVSAAELHDAQELKRAREIQAHNVLLLHEAGVELAIGPDVYRATALAEALDLHALGVLDELALLKMWCENTPRTIFPRRKIGHLAEGFEASFLVLDGNPLEDFEHVKQIRLRFKQGRVLELPSTARESK